MKVEVVPHEPPPVRDRPARPPRGPDLFQRAMWVRERRHNQWMPVRVVWPAKSRAASRAWLRVTTGAAATRAGGPPPHVFYIPVWCAWPAASARIATTIGNATTRQARTDRAATRPLLLLGPTTDALFVGPDTPATRCGGLALTGREEGPPDGDGGRAPVEKQAESRGDYSVTVGPRSHYVRCLGWPRCKFASHRRGDTPKETERKPCPRCGGPVVALPRRLARSTAEAGS